MRPLRRFLECLVLASALLAPAVLSIGCAARVRVYDQYHGDWHQWNGNEDRAYRSYLNDHHEQYRDFGKQSADEQRDYWNWRHDHPDQH